MPETTIRTAGCQRLAAQDRHVPEAALPLALSTFGPRRGGWVRVAIHGHLTARAADSTIE